MISVKFDKNNIESGKYLPEAMRYYVDKVHYIHKHGVFASALKASKIILNI